MTKSMMMWCAIVLTIAGAVQAEQLDTSKVPGVVVAHTPASSKAYFGSAGIAVLPDGAYLTKCDEFGPASKEWDKAVTHVFRSEDKGKTWKKAATVQGLFWSNIFVHRGKVYMMGPVHHHGDLVIMRSDDGGYTWTDPVDEKTGLLSKGQYHTAPMPIIEHNGRLWRTMEDASNGRQWGRRYSPMMWSVPVDADLLDASAWTHSNFIKGDTTWLDGKFVGWLEGNAVVTPEGKMVDILRVENGKPGGVAAIVEISDDGKTATFDPKTGFIPFDGGSKKFLIRYDEQTKAYWALANPVLPKHRGDRNAASTRNALALMRSTDLKDWEIRCVLLYHPDTGHHGFQYPDWLFDGDDILAAVRTAYDDGLGGAHNAHDANFLTFHRFKNFRNLTLADSVVNPKEVGLVERPLNVLFIAVDDMNCEIGPYGSKLAKTPNLDKLAKRGMVFERAYCQQALCNPSRSSLLTGLRPDTLKLWNLEQHFRDTKPDVVTLPQMFKNQGYFTQGIGKIFHNWRTRIAGDPDSWSVPQRHHFNNHSADWVDSAATAAGKAPREDAPIQMLDVPDEAYWDGQIAAEAVDALGKMNDRPFFLAVGFWKPHTPFNAPKKYWDMYDRATVAKPDNPNRPVDAPDIAFHSNREIRGHLRIKPDAAITDEQTAMLRHGYLAAISYVDAQIGKVVDALDQNGLADRTVVVFWSDHGYHIGDHTLWCKTSNFELDARVPLIIATPGMTGGQRTRALVELLDLYPTLADVCGLMAPGDLEGVSLKPVLDDPGASVKDATFTQHPRHEYYKGTPEVMGYSIRTDRWRYTEWRKFDSGQVIARELYDHDHDPMETRNIVEASDRATDVKELADRLALQFPRTGLTVAEFVEQSR